MKRKYRFNPKTLNYEKVKPPFIIKLIRFLFLLAITIAFSIGLFIAYYKINDKSYQERINEHSQLLRYYRELDEQYSKLKRSIDHMRERDAAIYSIIFEADPIAPEALNTHYSKEAAVQKFKSFTNEEILVTTSKMISEIEEKMKLQSYSFDEIMRLSHKNKDNLSSIPSIMPIANRDLTRAAAGYGILLHPKYKINKFHPGMDFTAPEGTEVLATGAGKVSELQYSKRGRGNHLIIDHGNGYQTLYGHLQDFNVKRGQEVTTGDTIGYVGNTGLSFAPHLHYEVIFNGKQINPVNYFFRELTPEEYVKMIKLVSHARQSFD